MDPPPHLPHTHHAQEAPFRPTIRNLPILDPSQEHTFITPVKRINDGHDLPAFLTSKAYSDIGTFVMQLNIAMCPRKSSGDQIQTWQLDSQDTLPEPVRHLQELLKNIDAIIEEAPPDTGPRRFGNVSFRKWYEILGSRVQELLQRHLPRAVLEFRTSPGDDSSVLDELTPYLLGAFGSSQRLDYGTGHELSFLAFLGCIWKLGGFKDESFQNGAMERSIVLRVIEPYLRVVRRLILTYTLEPAGSHGVWGLDDHSFLPYIFGSSQYCPAIINGDAMPVEGSLAGAPKPGDIAKKPIVDRERRHNMYFSAVGFINDVKTGPFWEHSPILFDISGVRSGWGKINKGMIKMYNAEVLSKFPYALQVFHAEIDNILQVVQHFPFGSLFSWDQDPEATQSQASVHHVSQPDSLSASSNAPTPRPPQESTRAPWANPGSGGISSTAAPWARVTPSGLSSGAPPTRAPWASQASEKPLIRKSGSPSASDGPTTAPWADNRG